MKKNILAIAIASAVAAPAAMADAKIYGYFSQSLENVTDMGTKWDNRNSRVGIKGSEDLGNGLKAIYQFETGVNLTKGEWNSSREGANTDGKSGHRNTFVGLSGDFGTVITGRHDTPLRMIQPSDHFADSNYAGTNRSKFNGGFSGEDRLDNVVAYLSPSFDGISFAIAGAAIAGGDDASPANAISMNVAYGKKSDGIFLAAGYTTVSDDVGAAAERTNIRLTGQYKADGLTANAMVNLISTELADTDDRSITLGVAYDMGALTPKAKLAHVDNDDLDESWINMAIGLDYKLGKNTKAHLEFARIDEEQGAAPTAGDSLNAVSIGLSHKF